MSTATGLRLIVPLLYANAVAATPPVPSLQPERAAAARRRGVRGTRVQPGGSRVAVPRLQRHERVAAVRVHLVPQAQQRDARAGAYAELGAGSL